jgi:hypothetical protein
MNSLLLIASHSVPESILMIFKPLLSITGILPRVTAHGICCTSAHTGKERADGERPGSRINFLEMEQGEQNPNSRFRQVRSSAAGRV